jgi:hypothetical protein
VGQKPQSISLPSFSFLGRFPLLIPSDRDAPSYQLLDLNWRGAFFLLAPKALRLEAAGLISIF